MGAAAGQAGRQGDEAAAGAGAGPVPQAVRRGHVLDTRQGRHRDRVIKKYGSELKTTA